MNEEPKMAVLFIFYKDCKILLEQRTFSSFYSNLLVFPGGMVEDHELDNPEAALLREITEELGVEVEEFHPITDEEEFVSKNNRILKPYLITKWNGEIPEKILDQGNVAVWVDIEDVLNSELEMVQRIGRLVYKKLNEDQGM